MNARRILVVAPVLLLGMSVATASAQDVYVVYCGKDRTLKDRVVRSMPEGVSVKTYNADLLALADYSGKQKAVTKISRAEVVVILGDKAASILKKTTVKSHLLIVQSVKKDIKSTESLLYVVGSRTNTDGISGRKVSVTSKQELQDKGKLRASKVLMIDETALSLSEAVSVIAQALI